MADWLGTKTWLNNQGVVTHDIDRIGNNMIYNKEIFEQHLAKTSPHLLPVDITLSGLSISIKLFGNAAIQRTILQSTNRVDISSASNSFYSRIVTTVNGLPTSITTRRT